MQQGWWKIFQIVCKKEKKNNFDEIFLIFYTISKLITKISHFLTKFDFFAIFGGKCTFYTKTAKIQLFLHFSFAKILKTWRKIPKFVRDFFMVYKLKHFTQYKSQKTKSKKQGFFIAFFRKSQIKLALSAKNFQKTFLADFSACTRCNPVTLYVKIPKFLVKPELHFAPFVRIAISDE